MDTYYFFVPNRLVWNHWKEFMGENTQSAWLPSTTYTVPKTIPPTNGWSVGSIADYLGVPVGVYDASTSDPLTSYPMSLPFRGYALICNEFFRDQNLTNPLNITLGDSNTNGSNGTNYVIDVEKGGKPFIVAKYHDYFTSCTKAPQKGPDIGLWANQVNQTTSFSSFVPVYSRSAKTFTDHTEAGRAITTALNTSDQSLNLYNSSGTVKAGSYNSTYDNLKLDNLWADVGKMNLTINDLRIAFQLQKFYEKQATSGSRYREILKEMFNVTSSDARMQIPEYLGGHRFPLTIHQIANQAESSSSALGELGAMSNTSDINEDFIKSFEEHGFVIGVCCCRYSHSYPQGLERFWKRNINTDYYYPVFANIGFQPVYRQELYYTNNTKGNEVFAYQEAWSEYRYKPNRVSGELRPGVTNSLATWHLSDYYTSTPYFSDAWIREDKSNVDRVLSVQSSVANQIFADFYVQNICTRPMPMFSVPGLIDHH